MGETVAARKRWLQRIALIPFTFRVDTLALTAVQVDSGDITRFSYREMARVADRIAIGLSRMGVGRSDAVACQLPNWWCFTLTYLA